MTPVPSIIAAKPGLVAMGSRHEIEPISDNIPLSEMGSVADPVTVDFH